MKILRVAPLVLVLCACEMSGYSDSSDAVKDTANVDYYPDDELLVSAKVQFNEGNFGKSFRMFEQALDVTPNRYAAPF